jgi:hypothetical protein
VSSDTKNFLDFVTISARQVGCNTASTFAESNRAASCSRIAANPTSAILAALPGHVDVVAGNGIVTAEVSRYESKVDVFGEIEVQEQRYDYDVVIDWVDAKEEPQQYRDEHGHTPYQSRRNSVGGGAIVGTGAYGRCQSCQKFDRRRSGVA